MGGRVKRGFLTDDGRWIIHWQELRDDPESDTDSESGDYTGELILAMATLTDKQRFVIECRYGLRPDCPPMSVCEIASAMGISHQAVTRLMQRALCGLRRRLQKTPIDVWGKIEEPA